MISDAKAPKGFRAEALDTANYLRNRKPSRSTNIVTPIEKCFRHTPNVKHLRVFGSAAFAHKSLVRIGQAS